MCRAEVSEDEEAAGSHEGEEAAAPHRWRLQGLLSHDEAPRCPRQSLSGSPVCRPGVSEPQTADKQVIITNQQLRRSCKTQLETDRREYKIMFLLCYFFGLNIFSKEF